MATMLTVFFLLALLLGGFGPANIIALIAASLLTLNWRLLFYFYYLMVTFLHTNRPLMDSPTTLLCSLIWPESDLHLKVSTDIT